MIFTSLCLLLLVNGAPMGNSWTKQSIDDALSDFFFKTATAAQGKVSKKKSKQQYKIKLPDDEFLSFAAGDDSYYAQKDFMIVADGVGSDLNSDLFSRILVDQIADQVQNRSTNVADPKDMLESAHSKAQKKFKEAGGYHGATTVVFTYLDVIIILIYLSKS